MKRLVLLLCMVLCAAGSAMAQHDMDPAILSLLRQNPARAGINTAPYEYLPAAETPVPSGYKPFYISHYGRHGSRSNSGGKGYDYISGVMRKAAEAGILTPVGVQVRTEVDAIIKAHNNMDGRLTDRGAREHRQIAARMYRKYKSIFRRDARIRAFSSTVPRCIVSMAAFTGELLSRNPSLDVSWDTGEAYMPYLATSDTRAIRDSVHRIIAAKKVGELRDTASMIRTLFTDPVLGRRLAKDPVRLMDQLFEMGRIAESFDIQDCIFGLMSEEDLYRYAEDLSVSLYLRQCNSVPFGDERMETERPIIRDLIDKADEAIRSGSPAVDLRFGHDWQLLAFCSRVGIEGVGERFTPEQSRRWFGFLYTPFAGNVQFIFYRGRKGDVLVKACLNEREARIIGLSGGPYYAWDEVKALLAPYYE